VLQNRLTVLHGLSGLGKSSLLRAGLFPALRARQCLPVYLRLSFAPDAPMLVDQVFAAIDAAARDARAKPPARQNAETLWEYFQRHGNAFWSERNRLLTPVLAFDQFEEIFTLGAERRAEESKAFLEAIADLAEGRAPQAVKARLDGSPAEAARAFDFSRQACRVLLSLREDYLAHLEDLRHLMPTMGNRMRLRPLNGIQALTVVSKPGGSLVTEGVAEQIVAAVAGPRQRQRPPEEQEIDPALLCLLCRELNRRRIKDTAPMINAGMLTEEVRAVILGEFYEQAVGRVSETARRFVEDKLLLASGQRDSVALEVAQDAGVDDAEIEALVAERLVRREERGGVVRLELTHDVLTDVVRTSRDQREQRKRRKLVLRLTLAFCTVALALVGFAYYQKRDAQTARLEAEIASAEALTAHKNAEAARDAAIEVVVTANAALDGSEDDRQLIKELRTKVETRQPTGATDSMTERATLQKLIDDGTIATTLRKGSSAQHTITALQTVLHWLGFDRALKWEKLGADGVYGKATIAAVAEFAKRNDSMANGEWVSSALAEKILARYDSLGELKQLAEDVDEKKIERYYKRGGTDQFRIAALQTLLNDLGFGKELNWNKFGADGDYDRSISAAVAAFGKREGLGGDGTVLTMPLAKRIVTRLGPFYGGTWHTPSPAPGSLSVSSVVGIQNRQYLKVSDGVNQKQFRKFRRGLFTSGSQKPAAFLASHADQLRALKVTQSEINVMIAVAANEGNLDAINTWDNAFLSFGLFQWSVGAGSEKGHLPALLARIKNEDRELFDKYWGQLGLDVAEVTTGPVYGYFSLRGTTIKTPAAKAQLRQPSWAFYFWLFGQDPAVQAMQFKHALATLDQFYSTDRYMVDNKYLVSDLVTSEYGVAVILDNYVNRPVYVKACLAKALNLTGLRNPGQWGTEEERKFIDAYLKIRVTYGRFPMTDAEKRGRVTKKYLTNDTISDHRGSFKRF